MSTAVLVPARSTVGRPAVGDGSTLQITRRGRLVLVALLVAVAFLTISVGQAALGRFSAEAGSGSASDAATTWVVQPGETLWSIAEKVAPGADPRETVARIESMNDLSGSAVVAGSEIYVPARG